MKLHTIVNTGKKFMYRLGKDAVSAYAAQAAFYILISCFPFAMLLITLLDVIPFSQPEILHQLTDILPRALSGLLETTLQDVWSRSVGNVTVISITAITTVWASSKGFFALTKGLNAVYRIDKHRSWLMQKLLSLLYTFVFALLLLIILGMLVFGKTVFGGIIKLFPAISEFALLLISLRGILSFGLLVVFFLLVYLFVPNRRFKKEQILTELPGAVVSAAGWIGFSYLYAYYIENFGASSYVYGSLTAVVFLMLWLYFCMYIMLVGAEINTVLQTELFEPVARLREARHQKIKERKDKKEQKKTPVK